MKSNTSSYCLIFSEESTSKIVKVIDDILSSNSTIYLHILYVLNDNDIGLESKIKMLKFKFYNRLIIKKIKYKYSFLDKLYFKSNSNIIYSINSFISTYKKYAVKEKYLIFGDCYLSEYFRLTQLNVEHISYEKILKIHSKFYLNYC